MSAEANATLIRTVVEEFQRGDLAAVATHFAPDAVWELPGRGVLAGEYKGPEAIVGFLARSFELSGGTLRLEVMDVLASPTGGAHVQRVTADHQGRRLDCVEILAHEIADGLIVRTYHRPDPYAIDAFFS
jgi:ketosteroid isomerase-like protein